MQLALELDTFHEEEIVPEFARRIEPGPGRLLRALIRQGCPEHALRAAAMIVVVLDESATGPR